MRGCWRGRLNATRQFRVYHEVVAMNSHFSLRLLATARVSLSCLAQKRHIVNQRGYNTSAINRAFLWSIFCTSVFAEFSR